jgi:hypothetical protein
MRPVGTCDHLQARRHVAQLGLAQLAGEVLADAPKMRLGRPAQNVASLIGYTRQHHPSIVLDSISPNHSGLDEPVDDPGEPARGHHHPFGEIGHAKRSIRGSCQTEQDVVVGQRDPMLGSELGVERSGHLLVRVQECLPGSQLRLAEICLHRG